MSESNYKRTIWNEGNNIVIVAPYLKKHKVHTKLW